MVCGLFSQCTTRKKKTRLVRSFNARDNELRRSQSDNVPIPDDKGGGLGWARIPIPPLTKQQDDVRNEEPRGLCMMNNGSQTQPGVGMLKS